MARAEKGLPEGRFWLKANKSMVLWGVPLVGLKATSASASMAILAVRRHDYVPLLMRRLGRCAALSVALLTAFVAASWLFIDWTDDGAGDYPGGVVLRDSAGNVIRVALGEGDVDCRPCYAASRDDWIVKALVAAEDGTFWTHKGVRPLSMLRAAWQNIWGRPCYRPMPTRKKTIIPSE